MNFVDVCSRPDIAAIRSLPPASRSSAVPTRVTDDHTIDTVRRQPSVQDGEAIKIVIHDVDCDPNISKCCRISLPIKMKQ